MKIIKSNMHYDFKINIANKYVTVASVIPVVCNYGSYNLFFYYYGAEYQESAEKNWFKNGDNKITVRQKENELFEDFLNRVSQLILKKLYIIGASIMNEIKYIEN